MQSMHPMNFLIPFQLRSEKQFRQPKTQGIVEILKKNRLSLATITVDYTLSISYFIYTDLDIKGNMTLHEIIPFKKKSILNSMIKEFWSFEDINIYYSSVICERFLSKLKWLFIKILCSLFFMLPMVHLHLQSKRHLTSTSQTMIYLSHFMNDFQVFV